VHEVVSLAQQAGVDAVRPGVSCQEIDRAARSVIRDEGYGEQFIHRTGHGIGVTTHEPPSMIEGCASRSSRDSISLAGSESGSRTSSRSLRTAADV
jgi:Xaa-Pro aminopeptidase